jgi:hypothetical protein
MAGKKRIGIAQAVSAAMSAVAASHPKATLTAAQGAPAPHAQQVQVFFVDGEQPLTVTVPANGKPGAAQAVPAGPSATPLPWPPAMTEEQAFDALTKKFPGIAPEAVILAAFDGLAWPVTGTCYCFPVSGAQPPQRDFAFVDTDSGKAFLLSQTAPRLPFLGWVGHALNVVRRSRPEAVLITASPEGTGGGGFDADAIQGGQLFLKDGDQMLNVMTSAYGVMMPPMPVPPVINPVFEPVPWPVKVDLPQAFAAFRKANPDATPFGVSLGHFERPDWLTGTYYFFNLGREGVYVDATTASVVRAPTPPMA